MATSSKTDTSSSSVKRRCAFCQKESFDMKTCSGCKKRAYCSVACQKLDWGTSGKGQGHKIWCKLDCCEEDIDWKVQEAPGKGLVALNDIPPLTRIIVERGQTWEEARNNPLLAQMSPQNESLETKFQNNAVHLEILPTGKRLSGSVFFKISKANHSCEPNTATWKVDNNSVLYSKCQIRKGEEICFSRRPLHQVTLTKLPPVLFLHHNSLVLQSRWNIFCPKNCVCKTSNFLEVATKAQKLKIDIVKFGRSENFYQMLVACRGFLALFKSEPKLLGAVAWIIDALQQAYLLCLATKKTEAEAKDHMETLLNLLTSIEHSTSYQSSIPPKSLYRFNTKESLRQKAWKDDLDMSVVREQNVLFEKNLGIPLEVALVRHCAFCLQEIRKFIICQRCRKRAFCSEDCKKKDWAERGQGHKNWCNLVCGEEDLDWTIRSVLNGKGLGVIALRDFPKGSRIMVDRVLSKAEVKNCPRVVSELSPDDGSFEKKFRNNCIGKQSSPGENLIVWVIRTRACELYFIEWRHLKLYVMLQQFMAKSEVRMLEIFTNFTSQGQNN